MFELPTISEGQSPFSCQGVAAAHRLKDILNFGMFEKSLSGMPLKKWDTYFSIGPDFILRRKDPSA